MLVPSQAGAFSITAPSFTAFGFSFLNTRSFDSCSTYSHMLSLDSITLSPFLLTECSQSETEGSSQKLLQEMIDL